MRLLHLSSLISLWALGCSLSHSPDLPSKENGGGDGDITGDGDIGVGTGAAPGVGGIPPLGDGGHPVGVGGGTGATPSDAGQGGELPDNLGGSR